MPRQSDDFRTVGRTWRARRNLVILAAWAGGVPPSAIAEALVLSRSRVGEILRAFRKRARKSGPPGPERVWP